MGVSKQMNNQLNDLSVETRIATNLAHIRASMAEAAGRVGRASDEVTLVAVSKTMPLQLVQIAYNLGVTDFGENRVQEALPKIAEFHSQGMRWHMIGHLQQNKAGKVVGAFDCVQSVDSLHLAQELQRQAEKQPLRQGKRLAVLLQVNVSGEASKEGMALAEAPALARQIAALPLLEIQGLMTIAPLASTPESIRPVFRELRILRERLQQEIPHCSWQHLSMGMSGDYRVAIEEGATIVRIGRAIFGERVNKRNTQP